MMLRFFLLAFAAIPCSGKTQQQIRGSRKLALQRIVGFEPRTQVTDHAAIDLDQASMEQELFLGRMLKARNVYEQGGHSKSFAELSLVRPHGPKSYPRGTDVLGKTPSGGEVSGYLMKDVSWGANHTGTVKVPVEYTTSDVQEKYVGCQVGGLFTFKEANRDGCYNDTGSVLFAVRGEEEGSNNAFKYHYNIRNDNKNGRTLQRFSLDAEDKMKQCPRCPYYDDLKKFIRYYGSTDYGNKWVMAAFTNSSTNFTTGHGNVNYHHRAFVYNTAISEIVSKGTVLLNVFMYVIYKMEDAVKDCERGCEDDWCNDDPVHAIDEAVAFYAGSLEGEDGKGDGKLLYEHADMRALNFRTCGESGTDEEGTSFVNIAVIREFKKAQLNLLQNKCPEARANFKTIINYMKVPIVQGVLRYGYIRQFENPDILVNDEKAEAEGATYAAALLPFVHHCDRESARTIYRHMRIGSDPKRVVFADIKTAVENTYACMGIKCSDVGGIYTVNGYADGAAPCEGGDQGSGVSTFSDNTGKEAQKGGTAAGATIGAISALALLSLFFVLWRKKNLKKKRRDSDHQRSGNIAAVSEIS